MCIVDVIKRCIMCGDEKPLTAFRNRHAKCTSCVVKLRRQQPGFLEKRRERDARWRVRKGMQPRSVIKEQAQFAAATRAEQRAARMIEIMARPWNAPNLTEAERYRIRYHNDPVFAQTERDKKTMLRQRIGLAYHINERHRSAFRNECEVSPDLVELIGYTAAQLRDHLQRQFVDGMSWDAFLRGEIHIEHILPLRMFNLQDADEVRIAWALSNVRPLWAHDNQIKAGARLHLL